MTAKPRPPMRATIDGSDLSSFQSFADAVARALAAQTGEPAYFGWHLSSFEDCLCGGFIGRPPYEIVVDDADAMLLRFGHAGLVRYCDETMEREYPPTVKLTDPTDLEFRDWYVTTRQAAEAGAGPTLLDCIFEVVEHMGSSLTLRARDGRVLRSTAGAASDP